MEPQQQRLLRKGVILSVEGLQGIQEIGIVSIEGPPFILGPDMIRLHFQISQEFRVVTGATELQGIDFGIFVEFQEFKISLDSGIITLGGDHTLDIAGDPGRAEIPQNADALIALLDIEIAQVLIADNGITDAHIA